MVEIAHFELNTPEQKKVITTIAKAFKIKYKLFKKEDEIAYNPEFVKKIKQSQQDIKDGKGIEFTISELEALCK